ncbi:hypothetical protein Ancab_018616 [Ancistrocladus abbreviatus]
MAIDQRGGYRRDGYRKVYRPDPSIPSDTMRLTEVKFDDQEWDLELFKGCYTGRLCAAEMIMGLTERLSKEGLLFCTIRHMGGKLCLLSSEDKAALKEMIE